MTMSSSYKTKIELCFLFLYLLEGSTNLHAVHSFEFCMSLQSALWMQKRNSHHIQSFPFHDFPGNSSLKKWGARALSSRTLSDFSLSSRVKNTGGGDEYSDDFDCDESNIEKQSEMARHSKIMDAKDNANEEWLQPRIDGFFGLDRDLTALAGTTTKETVKAYDRVGGMGILVWTLSVTTFVLVNRFIRPWPNFSVIPYNVWLLGHQLGSMVVGGGVVLTTSIEWLVVTSKNAEVLRFWFRKVPWLNGAIVLPGLTLSIVSGTALTAIRYGRLSNAPPHVIYTFWTLLVFAAWFALTDLPTQSKALEAVLSQQPHEHQHQHEHHEPDNSSTDTSSTAIGSSQEVRTNANIFSTSTSTSSSSMLREVPHAVTERMLSNAVSCLLVVVLYAIMILKLGTIKYW